MQKKIDLFKRDLASVSHDVGDLDQRLGVQESAQGRIKEIEDNLRNRKQADDELRRTFKEFRKEADQFNKQVDIRIKVCDQTLKAFIDQQKKDIEKFKEQQINNVEKNEKRLKKDFDDKVGLLTECRSAQKEIWARYKAQIAGCEARSEKIGALSESSEKRISVLEDACSVNTTCLQTMQDASVLEFKKATQLTENAISELKQEMKTTIKKEITEWVEVLQLDHFGVYH